MRKNGTSTTLILLTVTLLATLTSVFLLFSQSIRLDEAQSIWNSTKSLPFLLQLTAEDVNLPLYGIILHFWLQFWGNNIVYARALSLIFFVLTIPVIMEMAKESSNEKQALLTTILFAFSPFIGWYTSEARTYTLFALVTSLNHLYFLRMLKSNGDLAKTGFFLSALMGVYTHYFFLFLLTSQAIFILTTKKIRFFSIYFLLLSSVIFLFLPWGVHVLKEGGAANTQPLISRPTSYSLIQALVNFTFGFQSQQVQTVLVSLWPLLIIFLFLVFTQKSTIFSKNLRYFFLTFFLPIILVFIASFYRPIFLSRYLIIVTPSLFFLVSWLINNQPQKVSRYMSVGLTIILFGLMINQAVSNQTQVKEDYDGLVSYLNKNVAYTDIVLVSPPFTIYPVEYSYAGTAKITTIPVWDRYTRGAIPAFSSDGLVSQINEYKDFYNRIFVVLSYDQGYQNDIRDYLDKNYQLLDQKQFPNDISLRVYKTKY